MAYTVHIPQADIRFECEPDSNVLDGARKAGYELPYSCRSGICASCKGKVLQGSVQGGDGAGVLTAGEIADGYALLCQARPCTDLELAVGSVRKLDPDAIKTIHARVHKVQRVADDVTILGLRFPAGTRVQFKAGQFLQVVLADGSRRSYSMANPPHQNDSVQLHVRHVSGGRFTRMLEQGELQTGATLQLELPQGDFYLRDSGKPLIFVVSGTGFAPVKSILEMMMRQGGMNRPISLYWGARARPDLYLAELPSKWAQQYPELHFVPVLSDAPEPSYRQGLVHQAVMEDFSDLAGHEVYACGAPAMVAAARQDFVEQRGLPPDAFFCDAFVTNPPPV